MNMIEAILTGLRIAGAILWAWILWRILFESWEITQAPDEVRRRGWKWFRAYLATMAFAIAFVFSPENILRSAGMITQEQGYYLLALGSLSNVFCAALIHNGMDIVSGQHKNQGMGIYIALSLFCVLYSAMGGLL